MDVCAMPEAPEAVNTKVFLAIEGSASNAEEAVQMCADKLMANGCVTADFAKNCLDREVDFPTGICTEIPVALPHCKSDAILRSSLCYLRLDKPVTFRRMDDDELTVETRHIFNLAIAPGDHLEFLAKTMQLLQDSRVLKSFESMDMEEIAGYLQEHLA